MGGPPRLSQEIAEFVAEYFADQSARAYLANPRFAGFMSDVDQMSWSDAVKMFRDITGAGVTDGAHATTVAQMLARSSRDRV